MAQQPEQSSKVESWAYPCQLKDKGSAHGPEDYLMALATADDGFYPIGANGLWHGGIHFGAQTAGKFDQDNGIKCIADGDGRTTSRCGHTYIFQSLHAYVAARRLRCEPAAWCQFGKEATRLLWSQ
ncbi:TPA: hypothetical protein QDB48_006147 [Burkholderia vietnamiensis]|nr:hypothetical protein [Burkholderia vietnamiensis]